MAFQLNQAFNFNSFLLFCFLISMTSLNSFHALNFRRNVNAFRRLSLYSSNNRYQSTLKWPVETVRREFVDYFQKKHGHTHYLSSPCVPVNDPTLLFANAGMNQFKPIFIGTVEPTSPLAPLKRAVNSQKCIRAGGKHNDLDDVGKDTYHHTFFEMLGTWSFGDYFKKEAIEMAYDILVNTYKLDPSRLYASYFAGDEALGIPCDDEAREYWLKYLPSERVLPFDKKANFWEMGDTGPCGPCTEIHYDRIGGRNAASLVNADDPDVIEIWNLVFIQYYRENDGSLKLLPKKHIDTGMGLERLTSILQDKRSNYDTDVFYPIFHAIQNQIKCTPYSGKVGKEDAAQNYRDTAYRVIADHLRTLSFAIADGAVPSNDGRGYVLRRILRRAIRYGIQTLGAQPGFFSELIPHVINQFSGAFPELKEREDIIISIVKDEEVAFGSLLERGVKYFNEMKDELKVHGKAQIPGEKAFFLYDTLGFPIDLTQIMADENNLTVDIPGFHKAMNEQKERSRIAASQKRLDGRTPLSLDPDQIAFLKSSGVQNTNDSFKYTSDLQIPSIIKGIYANKSFTNELKIDNSNYNEVIGIVLDKTSFYAESGGQISDIGIIEIPTEDGTTIKLDVVDVQNFGGYILHSCLISDLNSQPAIKINSSVDLKIDTERRFKIAQNHSLTHVLNYILRQYLKEDISQKGSLVTDEKLRFDFGLNRGISDEDIAHIEKLVNEEIYKGLTVYNQIVPLSSAKQISGLRAVFGEVYPDPVRVLSIGNPIEELIDSPKSDKWNNFSIEFCGGTHAKNTQDAQAFAIVEESSIAKGIRRITAITGKEALEAISLSVKLSEEITLLSKEALTCSSSKDIVNYEESINRIRSQLDSSSIRQVTKNYIRHQIETIGKHLFAIKAKEAKERLSYTLEHLKLEAIEKVSKGEEVAVFQVDVGSDSKLIQKIIEEIKKVTPNLSILIISQDSTKCIYGAFVSKELQSKGVLANNWVQALSNIGGGKGGGKAETANGHILLSNIDTLNFQPKLLETAVNYIQSTLKK